MLTQAAIEKAKAKVTRYEMPDGLVPGLALVVHPTGRKTWALRYRPKGGKQAKLVLGGFPVLGVAEARAAARDALIEVGRGTDPQAEKMRARRDGSGDRDLFETVLDRFLASDGKKGKRRERTAKEWRRLIAKDVMPAWQGKRVQEITRRDARDVLDAVVRRGGGITANRIHTVLTALFNFADGKDIIMVSPMSGLDKPVAEESRDRVLTDGELRDLWLGLGEIEFPVGPFVKFLVLTGCRRSEAADLTWSEIDEKERAWLLPSSRSKNRQEKLTPLSDEAIAVLDSVPTVQGERGYVFTYAGKHGMTCFNAMKRKIDAATGVTNWTLHDLRRTCSSTLHRLGFPPHIVEATIGHRAAIGVAAVYNRHQYNSEKRTALDAWARFVVDNAEGKSADVIPFGGKRG